MKHLKYKILFWAIIWIVWSMACFGLGVTIRIFFGQGQIIIENYYGVEIPKEIVVKKNIKGGK